MRMLIVLLVRYIFPPVDYNSQQQMVYIAYCLWIMKHHEVAYTSDA